MIWNELLCDSCGMRSPGLRGRPRATLIRKTARAYGWRRIEVLGVVRDICPNCASATRAERARFVAFRRESGEELPVYEAKPPPARAEKPRKFVPTERHEGLEALLEDDEYFEEGEGE